MNVATLARAWLDRHDFSTFPPSGDGSYAPQRPLRLYSLNGIVFNSPVQDRLLTLHDVAIRVLPHVEMLFVALLVLL